MAKKIPVKLARDPIIEAVFEIRFQGSTTSISELLPGLMYPAIKGEIEVTERLPFADFPAQLIEADPNLRYQPRIRARGSRFSILIGDRSIIVSCPRPYVGWSEFSKILRSVLTSLQKTELISSIERCSVKYSNLLPAETLDDQFSLIKFSSNLGQYNLAKHLTFIRSEIEEEGIVNIVEVKSNSTVRVKNESFSGLLISVDSILTKPEEFWANQSDILEKIHRKEKEIFFDLLTPETIESYVATWE